ncbi:MAG TPA: hypothetical protein VFM16_03645 [Holophagaceae bacterium]|nr:hypothetical protein [Holophagaceae bacterium]
MLPFALLGPDDSAAAAGIMAFGCFLWAIIALVGLAIIAFQVWLFWRIFAKAGYSGAMGLLILLPGIGILIALCILAFGNWPIHPRRD